MAHSESQARATAEAVEQARQARAAEIERELARREALGIDR
jgi:hypothetical protein